MQTKLEVYNVNPKGKKKGDCVVRAIAYASGQTWEKTLDDLVEIAKKECCMPNDQTAYEKYLDKLGFIKHKQPRTEDNLKYTVLESYLIIDSNKYDVVVSVANHLTCLDNNKIIDTWNCGNKCIGNYWTRPKREETVRPKNCVKDKDRKVRIYVL